MNQEVKQLWADEQESKLVWLNDGEESFNFAKIARYIRENM